MNTRVKIKWSILKKMFKIFIKLLYLLMLVRLTPKSFTSCFGGYQKQIKKFEIEFDLLDKDYELLKFMSDDVSY